MTNDRWPDLPRKSTTSDIKTAIAAERRELASMLDDLPADRRARADAAAMSTAELAGAIRDNAHHPWKPSVGGVVAALGHDVVHGLDITVALGIGRQVPAERLRLLLEHVTLRTLKFFGADLDGVELRADDLGWSFGAGTPLTGAAQDLLLVAYGRKLPPGRLHGSARDRYIAV